jgi:hypothetical protein
MHAHVQGLNGRSAGCYPTPEDLTVDLALVDAKTGQAMVVTLESDAAMLLGRNLIAAGTHVDGGSHLARPIADWTPIQEGVTDGNDASGDPWETDSLLEG